METVSSSPTGTVITRWTEYIAYCYDCGWGTAGHEIYETRRQATSAAKKHKCPKREGASP